MTKLPKVNQKLYDLTQEWGAGIPPWPYFPDPVVSSFHRFPKDTLHSMRVDTAMHVGTHVDAPLHFNPEGWDSSEIPMDVLFGEGIVVDLEDKLDEFDIITPKMVEDKAEVRNGDILIIHTGWHKYHWMAAKKNEEKYFTRHPAPHVEFAKWAIKKKLKWLGADTPALDHPLNTAIRKMRPDLSRLFQEKQGKSVDELLPMDQFLQVHIMTAKNNLCLVENIAGDIDKVIGRRMKFGAFPWRFIRGEASICRVVAFEGF
ncbi:MAG: cyclase family protein [Nitrososphaerota archaeon]|nr:cyclase family protein [Nitrososphaerota archaeon]